MNYLPAEPVEATQDCDYPCGLFDFSDYWDMVEVVTQVLDLSREDVHKRLFYEALESGWNVSRAAQAFGVTPHVYDKQMEEFYKRTEAFVFELLVGHLRRYCQEIDRRVAQAVHDHFDGSRHLSVLALGDGIGTDSLRFAVMGHHVTYFEFAGHSSALAIHRFRRQALDEHIAVIHELEEVPAQHFDVVVCREVLEHVSNPPSLIEDMWKYLKDDGIAVVTESFGRVESAFPTHLAENRRYHGKTQLLFVKTGFRLLKSFPGGRPVVFQKTQKSDQSRFHSIDYGRDYVIRNLVKRAGRHLVQFIRF